MAAISDVWVLGIRKEMDSLGEVDVSGDTLWGAQTQRSLEHFSIGHDLIPREMITAYASLKKAAARADHAGGRLVLRPATSCFLTGQNTGASWLELMSWGSLVSEHPLETPSVNHI